MTLLNNIIFEVKKNKKILIALFIIYFILVIGVTKILVGFFYLKNGNSFILNNYKIEFIFPHWAYYGENKLAYVIAGQEINGKNLSAEFFKNPEKINIDKVISNCDNLSKQEDETIGIHGDMYICKRATNETMYFFSKDKEIFIRETEYDSTDLKIIREYKLLLDSISKVGVRI